ncbi:MAG: nucleolar RNA-binding Nop10p family protein [Promethearchaeota archaeon]
MVKYLLKCKECNQYGLNNSENNSKCSNCGGQLINPRPPKYSPIDKYGKYRREYFKDEFKKRFEQS